MARLEDESLPGIFDPTTVSKRPRAWLQEAPANKKRNAFRDPSEKLMWFEDAPRLSRCVVFVIRLFAEAGLRHERSRRPTLQDTHISKRTAQGMLPNRSTRPMALGCST